MAKEIKVLVTGAAGQIGYSLVFPIANGDVFGKDQPVHVVLLDIPQMIEAVKGVVLELQDCALPSLKNITATSDVQEAFTDIDYAILVGAMPRRQGMERKDLLKANAKIFEQQGKALDTYSKKTVKVLVVGNPANTNCLIAATCAPSIPKKNFTCLTRLDHNRAKAQIAGRLGITANCVENAIIWGNHSSTQYPDVSHASVKIGDKPKQSVVEAVKDDAWLNGDFITTVQKRGAAIIEARKLSSAMSAAKAICDHIRDWHFGTPAGQWTSMGIYSTGKFYEIAENLIYSMPVYIDDQGCYKVEDGLSISDASRARMDATANELLAERNDAFTFLQGQSS
uniref:Malate dehydrogenase n=1 Tax=Phallusia mammillata TaxID=59560 RepID=A0A6F9DKP4_9ASCI|nr:malate dehydrogenase, cytoplasmic-like [Phallusia mammillata]